MALRKFSKYMKVVSVLVIFSFVLTAGYSAYNFLINYYETHKVLMIINGKKIYDKDFNFQLETVNKDFNKLESENKGLVIPEELRKEVVLNKILSEVDMNLLIKSYKIDVSSSLVDAEFDKYVKQFGSESKLSLVLAYNGTDINSFKEQIKNNISFNILLDKIAQEINVKESDVLEYYEINQYDKYKGKNFNDIKQQVKLEYLDSEIKSMITKDISIINENAKIEFKEPTIKPIYESLQKVLIPKYNIKESTILPVIIAQMIGKRVDQKKATELTINIYNDAIKKYEAYQKLAKADGIVLDDTKLDSYSALFAYYDMYQTKYITNYKNTDKNLEAFFNKYLKTELTKPETADGYVFVLNYTPSSKDDKKALEKIEKIKSETTVANFDEQAKKYSIDKAVDLGTGNISRFVKPFADAIRNAKVGQIVGPIKTQFGYHIAYVVSEDKNNKAIKDVKHILIPINVSEETKKNLNKEVSMIVSKLKNKTLTPQELVNNLAKYNLVSGKEYKDVSVKNSQSLPFDVELELLNAKVGEVLTQKNDNECYIIVKEKQTVPVVAQYKDYKELTRITKAREEFSNKYK